MFDYASVRKGCSMQRNDNESLEDFLKNAVAEIRKNSGRDHKAARKRGEIFVKIQAQLRGRFMNWVEFQNEEWKTSNNDLGFDYGYGIVGHYMNLYKLHEKHHLIYKD